LFKFITSSIFACLRLFQIHFMGRIGFTELLPIIFIVLLLFGGKKIPELMKGLGYGIKEFKNASKDTEIKPDPEEKN
jgi:sec-independent protein translocase protein TatA